MDLSIEHFKNLWSATVEDFDFHCKTWECVCEEEKVPEDVLGEIRTCVGHAKLLKGQKLKQFRGLIDDSEFKTGVKEITLIDLQGFWDMVYNEVEKIKKSFKKLEDCKNNDWKFVEETIEKTKQKKVVKTAQLKKPNASNAHSEAARQRLADLKKKLKAQQQKENVPEKAYGPKVEFVVECSTETGNEAVNIEDQKQDVPSPEKISQKESLIEITEGKQSSKESKKKSKTKKQKENVPQKASSLEDVVMAECDPTEDRNKASNIEDQKQDMPSPEKIVKKASLIEITEGKQSSSKAPMKKSKAKKQKENVPQKASGLEDVVMAECDPAENGNKALKMDDQNQDVPSPEKIAKKESLNEITEGKQLKKAPKSKNSTQQNAKKSGVLKKSGQSKQGKENTDVNVQSVGMKRSKEVKDVQKIPKPEFEKRIMTRSHARALLAKQEAAKKS